MNARPLPLCSSPIADVAGLENEIPFAVANNAASELITAMKLDHEQICLDTQGLHLESVRLQTRARIGHDIEVCGSGMDHAQALRSALFPAVAQLLHADYANTSRMVTCKASDYLTLPGVEQAFSELMPVIAEQPRASIATTLFHEVNASRSLPVPTALVNAQYLHDVTRGSSPTKVHDDFDYTLLGRYSSNRSVAAGATQDEALLQGMLSAQEEVALGRFAVQGIGLRQRRYLRRVDTDTLPAQIRALWETTTKRQGSPVHLFDIAGQGTVPTYLACAEGPTADAWCVAAGAGISPEHAATRALRHLLQQHEGSAWAPSRHGGDAVSAQRRQGSVPLLQGEHRQFALQNLQEVISCASVDRVPFGQMREGTVGTTLASRIVFLQENFKRSGLTVWQTQYLPAWETAEQSIACVQVLIAPFDANYLLLQGIPVAVSLAALDDASNQG